MCTVDAVCLLWDVSGGLPVIWPARCTSLGCSAGKPACVIAAATVIMSTDSLRFQSTGLFRCYSHAPWYKLVTHLGLVSTLLTPPQASGGGNHVDTYTSVCNLYLSWQLACLDVTCEPTKFKGEQKKETLCCHIGVARSQL